MNKIYKFLFLICLILFYISCPISTDESSALISSIKITTSKKNNYFYINDNNNMQTIIASFYDEKENLINGKVEWESNLPKNTSISYSDNSYTFNIDSIKELGDYYVKAKVKDSDISSIYSFSYLSRDSLLTSLTYSYVSEAYLEVSDDNKITLTKAFEYDENGILIKSESERMILGDSLDYRINGSNVVLVSVKDGAEFGKISVKSDDSSLYSVPVNNDQFILYTRNDINSDIKLIVSAGTKDSRTISVNLSSSEEGNLQSPTISETFTAETEGVLVNITGDNISTSFYSFGGGNSLNISVYRKSYNGEDDYVLYDYLNNVESKDIKFGKAVHLANCGRYKIDSYITNAIGYKSLTTTKEVIVEPFPAPDSNVIIITPLTLNEQIYSHDDWDNYIDGDITPRLDSYDIKITNNDGLYDYYYLLSYNNDELSLDDFNESGCLSFNEIYNTKLKYAGNYKISVYQRGNALGYGFPLDNEKPLTANKECIIEGYSYYEGKNPISIETIDDGTIYIKSAYELNSDEHVYIASYIGSVKQNSYELNALKKEISISNPTFAVYTFKVYVFSESQRISNNISVYNLEEVKLSSYANPPRIDVSDSVQTTYNRRIAVISSSKDASGNYRKIRYKLGNGEWSEFLNPNSEGKITVISNITLNNSQEEIFVEMLATDNELGIGIVSSSNILKLTKLSPPRVWAHYKTAFLDGWVWLSFRCSVAKNPNIKGQIAYAYSNHGNDSNTSYDYKDLYYWRGVLWNQTDLHEIRAYQRAYGYIDSDYSYTKCGYGNGESNNYAGEE